MLHVSKTSEIRAIVKHKQNTETENVHR